MCHSFLDYPTYKRMQQPHALWRCGVCGRQSTMPMDCCVRPDYALQRQPGIVRLSGRQLAAVGTLVITRVHAWWQRRQRPARGGVTRPAHEVITHDADPEVRAESEVETELVSAYSK
jgi:hypothetical protein